MPGPPLIEVVIPVRDGARHLPATLASVAQAASPPPAVVAVDHGSADSSRALVADHLGARVIDHPGGRLSDVYNVGIAATSAPLVALMGQDDLYEPGALDLLAAALDRQPSAGLASGAVAYFLEPGTAPPPGFRQELLAGPRPARLFETTLWRGDLLRRLGPMVPRVAGDVDLFLRAEDLGAQVVQLPATVCRKRIVATSAGQGPTARQLLAAVRASVERKRERSDP